MEIDNKNKSILLFLTVGIALSIFMGFWNKKIFDKYLETSFSGKVENIRFCVKGLPYLKIKNNEYYISNSYTNSLSKDFKSFVQVGDSVVKEEGIGNLYVYRKVGIEYKEYVFKIY